jgi:hypothetical protein
MQAVLDRHAQLGPKPIATLTPAEATGIPVSLRPPAPRHITRSGA